MASQSNYHEADGLRFLAVMIGGIIVVMIVLGIVIATLGHFAAPDPSAI